MNLQNHLQERGLTLSQAAKAARLGEAYMAQLWRRGGASQGTAERLAHILQCPAAIFLYGAEHYERTIRSRASGTPEAGRRGASRLRSQATPGPVVRGPQPLTNTDRPRGLRLVK